jgi:hypothetical protein
MPLRLPPLRRPCLPPRRRTCRALALLLLAAAGCSRDPTGPPSLPPEFAILSSSPYIEGRIVERESTVVLRLLVRSTSGRSVVPEAVESVPAGARLLWPDGRVASPDDLRAGRAVLVWAAGPELQSLPPQVTASRVLVYGGPAFGRAAPPAIP